MTGVSSESGPARPSIATKRGDGGTTSLLYGGRVRKDAAEVECNGAVDEAQAALGMARAEIARSGACGPPGFSTAELGELIVTIERHLWALMAEVATKRREKLVEGSTMVSREMLAFVEAKVGELEESVRMPSEFVVPGGSPESAALDLVRTVVRRAERQAVGLQLPESSRVVPYLNRLSDLCWLLARVLEKDHLAARDGRRTS